MSDSSLQNIDDALQAIQRMSGTGTGKRGRAPKKPLKPLSARRAIIVTVLWVAAFIGVAALPLAVLLRTSVYLYTVQHFSASQAVILGSALTAAVLIGYALALAWKLGGRRRAARVLLRVVPLLVILYCGYALLYISAENVKEPALQQTYTTLHPLLRLSVSTLILADGDLVVTDTQRRPADYQKMGLPARETSLHYAQSDGYVHAVDLRTKGRAAWKNQAMTLYFRMVGLHTLRHVGTADHLHVSLPMPAGR
jgi:hypothetical protein